MSEETNVSSVTTEAPAAPEKTGRRLAEPEKPEKRPLSGGKKAGLIVGIIAAVLVLAYAGCCVAAGVLYSHVAFPGTSVLGMDVSRMSTQQVEKLWTEQGDALLDGMTFSLTRDGQEIGSTTLSDLGVTVLPVYVSKAAGCDVQDRGWGSDVTAFLRGGWRFIESWFRAVDVTPQLDVDEAKLTAACEQLSDTVGCTVTDGGYRLAEGEGLYITKPQDGEKLDAAALRAELVQRFESRDLSAAARSVECVFAAHTAAPMDVQALHDEIAGTMAAATYDRATGKPTQSRIGVQFDVETVQKQLDAAAPGAEFLADAQVQFPPASTEELETAMFRDVIGTCTTTCAGPWGRRQNIKLASAAIDGRIYNPGEEFWYNATVGQRTEARGFQPAAAYSGGKTVTSIGGGICQVSSTLYNAVVNAGLTVNKRTPHAIPSSYVDKGKDATVSDDRYDFVFTNNTGANIYIETQFVKVKGYWTSRFIIYGRPDPNGYTYKLDSQVVETIPLPEPTYEKDKTGEYVIYDDETQIKYKGREGYVVDVYLVTMDSNGLEISREKKYTDTYKAAAPIYYVGVTPRETPLPDTPSID